MHKIGIGVTVHNRNETATHTIDQIKKFMPLGSRLIVVDDASDTPYPNADFRFETNVGIAKAKNKCLELLEDNEHIFLFDDDCMPCFEFWYLPYINSPLNHACFTFDRKMLFYGYGMGFDKAYKEFEKPCGCMLYIRKICLDVVGGFDEDFKGYSYEHVNYSDRVFNAGLNPARYVDALGYMTNFIMANVPSSVSEQDRAIGIYHNEKLYKERYHSKEFKPYK